MDVRRLPDVKAGHDVPVYTELVYRILSAHNLLDVDSRAPGVERLEKGIKTLQAQTNQVPDGIVGPQTWVFSILGLAGTMAVGVRDGDPVNCVLNALLGFDESALSNKFTNETEDRVREVQAQGELDVDGMVSKNTQQVLYTSQLD